MNAVAGTILVAFGLFLVGLTVVVFAKPALAERFFMPFASSARAHHTEQVIRLLIGASLVVRSAAMWQSVAMAPPFRRESASDAHASPETICGRAIGVRCFTSLWRVCWGLPIPGVVLNASFPTRPT